MRGTLEYLSDVKGDCADDINLDLISSDIWGTERFYTLSRSTLRT